MDQMDRTSALGLWRYASDYAEAANIVQATKGSGPFIPTYYLYGHTIELVLKAFLRSTGYTVEKLKTLGHDLVRSLKAAEDAGISTFISLNDEHRAALIGISSYYEDKELEYIKIGFKSFPSIDSLGSCARTLVKATRAPCEIAEDKK
jgi:hypothetical protein